jgi:hypothetical protein
MKSTRVRLAVSILLASTGAALLILTAWPLPKRTLTSPFPPAYSLDYPGMQPVLLERENTIVIPEKLRAGQAGIVKFTSLGIKTDAAIIEGQADTPSALLEARLEIPGMRVNPGDSVFQPVADGVDLHYSWEILADVNGVYQGTLWIYLLVPVNGDQQIDRRPVQALPFEVETAGIPSTGVKVLHIAACILFVLAGITLLKGKYTSTTAH